METRSIDALKRTLSAVERAAIFGFFILHDSLTVDDVAKILGNIPELTGIAADAASAPLALQELKSLDRHEATAFVREITYTLDRVLDAIERIQATGQYKEVKALKTA